VPAIEIIEPFHINLSKSPPLEIAARSILGYPIIKMKEMELMEIS